jgi:hypothetical protein
MEVRLTVSNKNKNSLLLSAEGFDRSHSYRTKKGCRKSTLTKTADPRAPRR